MSEPQSPDSADRTCRPALGRFLALKPFKNLVFLVQRCVASARAGSFLGRFRRAARFAAKAIEQDGVLLLMPKEPSLAFIWVPLAIVFTAGGAILGALT